MIDEEGSYRSWDEDKERVAIQTPKLDESRHNTQVLEKKVEAQGYHSHIAIEHDSCICNLVDVVVPGLTTSCTGLVG
jgi:hypothetical protein